MKKNGCADKTYDIQFGNKSFTYYLYNGNSESYIKPLYLLEDIDLVIVISDKNIQSMYGDSIVSLIRNNFKCELITLECTEKQKDLRTLEGLIEKVLSLRATRRTCIIGFGGGICGNISGMVAALLFREIRYVHIPTSLMAILDSALSLKQAINSSYGKNLIGVFYTPKMVIANVDFLNTLPKSEVVSGICEVIKNALTILPDNIERLYETLNMECNYTLQDYRYFIDMSIKAKTHVMKNDPFEKEDALILEYGHTIGHAIELVDAEGISHGEAIGLGMLCAAEISHMLGKLSEEDVNLHKAFLVKAGAAIKIPEHIKPDTILSIMKFDNKRGYLCSDKGVIHMVLLGSNWKANEE